MVVVVDVPVGNGRTSRRYVVEQELDDGRLVLRPEESAVDLIGNADTRPLTDGEWRGVLAQYGADLLPPDGEG